MNFYERGRSRHYLYDDEPIQLRPEATRESLMGEKRWAASHQTFWGATQTYDELPAGLYRAGLHHGLGVILQRQTISVDDLVDLQDHNVTSILSEFEKFWSRGKEFARRGFLMKRGFLFHGGPGTGKTALVNILIQRLIDDHNGIVIFIDEPRQSTSALQMVRQIESSRPLIAVMEELDALIEKHGESEFLALLDGEAQVDNILFLATSNHPERIDRRFIERPSRFDTIKKIEMPSPASRRAFLEAKEIAGEELDEWVELSAGWSIAHLKELVIAVKCLDQTPQSVKERFENQESQLVL